MKQYIQTITRHFFKKDDLEQVAVEDLEEFIASYPYSSAGHLLLAKKLAGQEQSAFNRQAAVTSIYFTNPLWLHRMLGPSSGGQNVHEKELFAGDSESLFPGEDLHRSSTTSQDQAFREESLDEPIIDEKAPEVFAYKDAAHNSSVTTQETEAVEEAPPTNNNFFSAGNIAEEQQVAADQLETSPTNTFFAEENIPEHLTDNGTENAATAETINEPFHSGEQPMSPSEPGATAQISETDIPSPLPAAETQTVANNDQPSDTTLPIPGPNMNEQPDLSFQSYHTIDYFASQGIKLRQEDLTKDRFGQQVKSFTEWLRNMKRIAPPPVVEEEDASTASVRESAEHSFNEKEVITEAMAEVWIKQGNIEKAVAVYEKLSLLNPSKNAYFAAKIEQLKARL